MEKSNTKWYLRQVGQSLTKMHRAGLKKNTESGECLEGTTGGGVVVESDT